MAQHFILKALKEKKRFLILRKTLPSLKLTAYRLIQDILNENAIPYEINKSDMIIKVRESELYFKSLDDPEKIKSAEFDYIWIEEATELTVNDFRQLNLRLGRRPSQVPHQMFLTFNPIDSNHWLKKEIIDKELNYVSTLQTNYKDNPFLPKEYIEQLEDLKNQDETYYQVYAHGEWGVLKNQIYSNWDVVDTIPENYDEVICGLDFGYVNPTALIEVRIRENEAWAQELIYQSHLTNGDLIELLKSIIGKNIPIYADTAEPQRIEEIYQAGFNIYPANKDVRFGIDKVKQYKIHILNNSVNLIKEIRSYKWKEDKEGRILEEPVKFNDHAMDAMRYALASLQNRKPMISFL